MPEKEGESEDVNHEKRASDALFQAISNTKRFIVSSYFATREKLEQHPLGKIIETAVMTAVVGAVAKTYALLTNFFYGAAILVQRDFVLGTFPAPVGLSLWIVLGAAIFALYYSWTRIKQLRLRVEELESG